MRLVASTSKYFKSIGKNRKCFDTVQTFLVNLPKGFEYFMSTLWPVLKCA